jgi:NAD(P)-dependent dehydrogenase (short-subunit alcohol dehydrogenase family)
LKNFTNKQKNKVLDIAAKMNIIITGGSRGIGKETALCLAKNKDNQVLITGRNERAMRIVAESAPHDNIFYYVVDFMKLESLTESFREHVSSVFSIVDILINNAGNLTKKRFTDLSPDEIRAMMETNFFAPVFIIRTLLPLMKKGSHIVNIASMGGFQGSVKFSGLSCYSASKAALACLTECLAMELSGAGISVNCLAPGSVQTEMLEEAFPGYKAPVEAKEMGDYIAAFAASGNKYFNGKILPLAVTTP